MNGSAKRRKIPSPKVAVHLMRNEYRAGCFSISNATREPDTVRVNIAGLPGGANPAYLTVHEVQWTGTKTGIPVAAALPEAPKQDGGYVIEVPAGMTRQVWLTFHPQAVDAGTHTGEIVVASAQHGEQRFPVEMRVYPFEFPARPTLHFGGWDYSNGSGSRGVTLDNMAQFIAHCREHYVDSPWATSAVMPYGEYDATGAMTAARSTEGAARVTSTKRTSTNRVTGQRARWGTRRSSGPAAGSTKATFCPLTASK